MSIILLLIGSLLLFIAIKLAIDTIKLKTKDITVRGVIEDFEESESVRENEGEEPTVTKMYAPIIRFTAKNAEEHQFTSNISSSHPKEKKGDEVKVSYLPSSPQDAQLANQSFKLLPITIFGALGAICVYYGLPAF